MQSLIQLSVCRPTALLFQLFFGLFRTALWDPQEKVKTGNAAQALPRVRRKFQVRNDWEECCHRSLVELRTVAMQL